MDRLNRVGLIVVHRGNIEAIVRLAALRRLGEWLFYGHVWIALAATGLGWMSVTLCFSPADVQYVSKLTVLALLFFATLGVYTLHRLLSFRKVPHPSALKRYRLVAQYPKLSLLIGVASLLIAGFLLRPTLAFTWPALVPAVPATVFYLVPPLPGVRRLRDVPYIKTILVGISWAFITHSLPLMIIQWEVAQLPVELRGSLQTLPYSKIEFVNRFFLVLAVALLFDLRDTELDARQGVKTFANTYLPYLPPAAFVIILLVAWGATYVPHAVTAGKALSIALPLTYFGAAWVALKTVNRDDEGWYAVAVDGILLAPPVATALVVLLG